MNIPYVVLIIQIIVLCLFWYFISIRKLSLSGFTDLKTGLPDNELLLSIDNKITNSNIRLDNNTAGNTIWTSERIIEEIKKQPIQEVQVGLTEQQVLDLIKKNPPAQQGVNADQVINMIKAAAQPKVYFDVSRNNSMKTTGIILYAAILTQSFNSGIDITKGIFTSPISGLYRMTWTGLRYYFVEAPTPTRIIMKKNGVQVAVTASTSEVKAIDLSPKPPGGECLSINILLNLIKGDTVHCEIEVGGIYDTAVHHVTHFTGELMIET